MKHLFPSDTQQDSRQTRSDTRITETRQKHSSLALSYTQTSDVVTVGLDEKENTQIKLWKKRGTLGNLS